MRSHDLVPAPTNPDILGKLLPDYGLQITSLLGKWLASKLVAFPTDLVSGYPVLKRVHPAVALPVDWLTPSLVPLAAVVPQRVREDIGWLIPATAWRRVEFPPAA